MRGIAKHELTLEERVGIRDNNTVVQYGITAGGSITGEPTIRYSFSLEQVFP